MRALLVISLFAATAACTNSTGNGAMPLGTDGGASSGADASATPGDDGSASASSFTVTFGPIQVDPGTERTQCIVVRLGNQAAIHVGQIHNLLGTSSHHMIVYRVNDTVERPTPFDCAPFTDTLDIAKGNPLVISQKKDDTLTLPQGVGFTFDANQMIRLEMHYINASATAQTLRSTSTMIPVPDAQYQQEASFLFMGDLDISIPAQSAATVGPIYVPVPSGYESSNFFAITGHEHQWGKNVRVWTATSATDPGTPIYDVPGWLWSEPKTVTFSTPFQVPTGGGFKFQCDWFNASSSTVGFSESATGEMCFFWAYYYPSHGAKVCFHTLGADQCCPGTSPICAIIANAGASDAGGGG
jgi:hypothetical protein